MVGYEPKFLGSLPRMRLPGNSADDGARADKFDDFAVQKLRERNRKSLSQAEPRYNFN
jgi:hypothetical protein